MSPCPRRQNLIKNQPRLKNFLTWNQIWLVKDNTPEKSFTSTRMNINSQINDSSCWPLGRKKIFERPPNFLLPTFTKTLCLLNKQIEIEVLLMVVLADSIKHITVCVLYSFLCYLKLCHQFVKFIILLLFIQNIPNS